MMDKTPRIIINGAKVCENFLQIKKRCQAVGVEITTVLKGVAGDEVILNCLVEAGLVELGDSRLENLQRFRKISGLKQTLLRLPAITKLVKVLEVADVSLNAEIGTLVQLEKLAIAQGKEHQVILMVDLGDLREGFNPEALEQVGAASRSFKKLKITGLGSNFSCFAGVQPTVKKLTQLVAMAETLRRDFGLPIERVSGGNSSTLPLVYQGNIPVGINHLRIGEGILLGKETLTGQPLPGLHTDAFIIEAEVLQSQLKPGQPDGDIGFNAFGQRVDLGETEPGYRALLNLGEQDTGLAGLTPHDPELKILGGSSDYTVLASKSKLNLGTRIRFVPNYWSLLTAMTCPYMHRSYS